MERHASVLISDQIESMANPFENLLSASLAASQLRQGYNQMAMQDKQATGSLLQRRAEQEQQGQQFVMSLNQQKSEQAMRADQFNRSLNFNYSQLRQQDKWANADDIFRREQMRESTRQFDESLDVSKDQFNKKMLLDWANHGINKRNESAYSRQVGLQEQQYKDNRHFTQAMQGIQLQGALFDLATKGEPFRSFNAETGMPPKMPPYQSNRLPGAVGGFIANVAGMSNPVSPITSRASGELVGNYLNADTYSKNRELFKKNNIYGAITQRVNVVKGALKSGARVDETSFAQTYTELEKLLQESGHVMTASEKAAIQKDLQYIRSRVNPSQE